MMCDVLSPLSELSKAMQTRDVVFTTLRPLVRGTLAHLRALQEKPGENFVTAKERVTELREGGNNIKIPTNEQVDTFQTAVYQQFLAAVIEKIDSPTCPFS
ncbi:hypothetical protein DPMN_103970 [Dreissena polymorpha]|uniref:Uncharacterized protein n=1 Tax=Dreissena polymorpha TaxID=45954 RepID=A0A9D4K0P8_DREPO|nr:hypothetical protein DPMN_103970 [Dreissena polymorpha]